MCHVTQQRWSHLFTYSEAAQFEVQKNRVSLEISELKRDNVLLENQLEMEKMKVEAEKKKLVIAHETLREKVSRR